MKKIYCALTIAIFFFAGNATAQINFPDENFRSALMVNYGLAFDNANNLTNPEIAAAITELDVQAMNISDLKGIEAFTGLQVLDCVFNNLTTLDLSSNPNLSILLCEYNQIESLIITANQNLTELSCHLNQLSELDVSQNLLLQYLSCGTNLLTELDVSQNIFLTGLNCSANQINSLDVSNNNLLVSININGNPTPFTLGVWTESFPPEGLTYNDTESPAIIVFGALPVELIDFTVNGNTLKWSTATETNNSGWDIEIKGEEGNENRTWEKVGFVSGKGTTTIEQKYSFTIQRLNTSRLQARLKQIDFNGNSTYSNVLTIDAIKNKFSLSDNYPNPFNPTTKINYQLKESGYVTLKVFDALGREVKSLVNQYKLAGEYQIDFDGSGVPSGVYFYKFTSGSFTETKKMVLMK